MTAMVAEQLANAAASGEVDLGEIGRETAASLFNNLVRGEPQLQCLTHPDAAPSSAQIDQWANAAVVTFMRAYGRGEDSPNKRSQSRSEERRVGKEWVSKCRSRWSPYH